MKTSKFCVLFAAALSITACADSDELGDEMADDDESEAEPDNDPEIIAELDGVVLSAPMTGRCITPELETPVDIEEDALAEPDPAAADKVTIKVNFHVINARINGKLRGNLSRARIVDQIQALNRGYGDTKFHFALNKITRTTNRTWFRMKMDSAAERAAKNALNAGGTRVLNIYSTGTGDALGWSSWPSDAGTNHDGIVIHFGTTPNGSGGRFSLGDTATHEVGHWLGLFHTFGNRGNGCAHGDGVADTNPEFSPAFGCPTGRDTCSGDGDDPIHNFMDYTDDSCMFRFTPKQRARMNAKWARWRD